MSGPGWRGARRRLGLVVAALLASASALALAADPSQTLRAKRHTAADAPVELRTHAHWDGQCRSINLPVVTWVENPSHGRVEQSEGQVAGHAAAVGATNCDGVAMRGLRMTYTPQAGWHGADHLVYDVRYGSSDSVVRYEFSVTVD